MPRMESVLYDNKLKKKHLVLVLDENDSILGSIKKAMEENKINETKVEDINGILKEGTISFMDKSSYKAKKLVDRELLRASGNFKLSYGDLYGVLNISTKGKPPLSGTLTTGIARQGLEIKLSFFSE